MSQYSTGLELILNAAEGVLQIVITEDEQPLCVQEWHRADRATEILAPALTEICATLGIKPTEFRRIACVRGPGSFTGIRLVLATAAALRRSGQARLAGLDYMQALAASAVLGRGFPYGTRVWAITHARRNLVHCQPFLSYGPQIPAQALSPVDLCSPQDALQRLAADKITSTPVWICGSGLARNAAVYKNIAGMGQTPYPAGASIVALPEITSPTAGALRLLARHGEYFAEDIEPLYVRQCDAVENLPQLAPRLGMNSKNAVAALDAMLERTPQSEI